MPQPGTWTYSDIGFVTLGFAIVGATTAPYPDLLADTITTPLGMANTWGVIPASVPASQIATGYIPGASGPFSEPVQNGTDIKSNIVDMLAWTAANLAVLEAGPSLPTPLQQAMGLCVSTQVDSSPRPGRSDGQIRHGSRLGNLSRRDNGRRHSDCQEWRRQPGRLLGLARHRADPARMRSPRVRDAVQRFRRPVLRAAGGEAPRSNLLRLLS